MCKKLIKLFLLMSFVSSLIYGSDFSLECSLPDFPPSDGHPAFGDFNNDGSLDLLFGGVVYENNNGEFIKIETGPPAVSKSWGDWGDYDNDGDLDIVLTGRKSGSAHSEIYKNENGVFTPIDAGLTGVYQGACKWADYDNDGDLDVLISGQKNSNYQVFTGLYRNDGNDVFEYVSSGITNLNVPSFDFGDYDNDGDLDLLISGFTTDFVTKLYRNDSGVFTNVSADLDQVDWSSANWGDYDNDGDLDILLTGMRDYYTDDFISKVYRNDNGEFTDIEAGLPGIAYSYSQWGDYDSDGDLDIVLSGMTADKGYIAEIYRNDNNSFVSIDAGFSSYEHKKPAFGDYDGDGDLDCFISKNLYKNNLNSSNSKPSAPADLISEVNSSNIVLSWGKSTDSETPQDGLTYNIMVGTQENNICIVSPMSHISTGINKRAKMGLTKNNSWTLKGLPMGTYYWSVQAVDTGFKGSLFSDYGTFTITTGIENEEILNPYMKSCNYPNPFNPETVIEFEIKEKLFLNISIYSVNGSLIRTLSEDEYNSGVHKVKWDGQNNQGNEMPSGIYFYEIKSDKQSVRRKINLLK